MIASENFPRKFVGSEGRGEARWKAAVCEVPERDTARGGFSTGYSDVIEYMCAVSKLGDWEEIPTTFPLCGSLAGVVIPAAVPERDTTVRRGFNIDSDTPTLNVISC